jgi:hypothetical protein
VSDDAPPSAPDRSHRLTPAAADAAALAGAIERWAADLAIGEEPSGFLRALEDGAR